MLIERNREVLNSTQDFVEQNRDWISKNMNAIEQNKQVLPTTAGRNCSFRDRNTEDKKAFFSSLKVRNWSNCSA